VFGSLHVKRAAFVLALSTTLLAGRVTVFAAPGPPAGPDPGLAGKAPVAFTGVSGRVALGDLWYYRPDAANAGLAQGWRKQRFPGRGVRPP